VLPDNRAGFAAAVLHLVALGHRRIAHITGTGTTINGQERLLYWREAMGQHGLASEAGLVAPGNFTVESGHQAMGRLCDAPGGRPTAVVCGNDRMALGAMRCLAERGLRVPEDVSIVGFDDIDTATYTTPSLTTVRVPSIGFADTLCRTLLEDMAIPVSERSGRTIRVPAQLVIRGSTGLVPGGAPKT
jgi:LacI family repressor for deo operon, udp, cdd, tsx, nupC, and nupG